MDKQTSFATTSVNQTTQDPSIVDRSRTNEDTLITQNIDNKYHMDILLRQARRSLQDFLKPDFLEVTNAPLNILQEGKGILFVTILQDGNIGAGVFFRRLSNKWSAPCVVLIEDAKLGLSSEFERTKHIIVLKNEQYLDDFANNNEITLKDDNSISTLSIGRDFDHSIEVNETGFEEVKKVSTVKGTNLEDSLDGLKIRADVQWNQEFYQKPVTAKEIFAGNVEVPYDIEYKSLCNMLQHYSSPILNYQNTITAGNENENFQLQNDTDNRDNVIMNNVEPKDTVTNNKNSTSTDISNTNTIERSSRSDKNVDNNINDQTLTSNILNSSNNKNDTTINDLDSNKSERGSNAPDPNDISGSQTDNSGNQTDNSTGKSNNSNLDDTDATLTSNMLGSDNKQTNYGVGLRSRKHH